MAFIGNNPSFKTTTLRPMSTRPANPVEGMIYYDDGTTNTEGVYKYQNSNWEFISSLVDFLRLNPQSADPTSPTAGDIQYSDGTARPQGLWSFNGTFWERVGAGVSDKAVYAQFDAEDQDVSSFTNISTTSTSPINEDFSYSVDSYPASLNTITLSERHLNKLNGLEFHYRLTSGSAIAQVKDQLGNVLGSVTLDSTSVQLASLQYFVNDSVTSIQLEFLDDSSATGLVVDDLVFTDSPFVSTELSNIQGASILNGSPVAAAAVVIENPIIEGSGVFTFNNGEYTIIQDKTSFFATFSTQAVNSISAIDVNYGSGFTQVSIDRAPENGQASASWSGLLNSGDKVRFRNGTNITSSGVLQAQVLARCSSENLVFHQSGTENTFSARINLNNTANGVSDATSANIVSSSVDFIDSTVFNSDGNVTINFKPGFFTTPPAAAVTLEVADGFGTRALTGRIENVNSTSVTVLTTLSASTSPSSGNFDFDFNIFIQNQGADYKNPNAYAVVPNSQVAILQDVKPSGVEGGAFIAGDWRTRVLNTTSGDNFVSLDSINNTFTLPTGKYVIDASAQAFFVSRNQLRIRDISNNTTIAVGSSNLLQANNVTEEAELQAVIEITSPTILELQHRCETTRNINGFGTAANFDETEIYATVKITKIL